MLTVLIWWLWMQVIGLAALPLAYRFFRQFPDRGYAFARSLGLLLTGYLLWLGASFGLLRNSFGGILFCIIIVALISLASYRRGRDETDPGLFAWLRSHWRLAVSVELLFAAALALWSLVRAYSPELTTAGGEKFMEIMYLNSIGRSEYFPPHDAWLSGYAISYYYFGYVLMAMLTRLSGLAAHLTFNVGVALLFALTCTGAFGLVYNLVAGASSPGGDRSRRTGPIAFGYLGAALVALLGNLEGFLEVLYSARLLPAAFWRWLDILDINQPFDPSLPLSLVPARSGWWWWRASRVIHDLDPLGGSMGIQPIDEFPGFSFLLGDMHPHVLALPFVLLALAVALRALLEGTGEASVSGQVAEGWWGKLSRLPLLVAICLGALGFLNTWDFPIYLLVFVAAYGLGRWGRYQHLAWPFVRDVALTGLTVAVLGFVFYLPFYIGFQSQAGGLLPALYVGTRFRQYFVMFGPLLVAIAGLLALLAVRLREAEGTRRLLRSWIAWTATLIVLPLGAMLLLVLAMLVAPQGREFLEEVRRMPFIYPLVGDEPWLAVLGRMLWVKLRTWVMPLAVGAMAGLGMVLLQRSVASGTSAACRGDPVPACGQDPVIEGEEQPAAARGGTLAGMLSLPSIRFALLCAVVGLLLTLSVEFVYLVDVFRVRMNTIFKFYFQAWVLMAITGSFSVYWLTRSRGLLRTGFLVGFWFLFATGMVYPVLGNYSRAGAFQGTPQLDGTAYLAESHPEDYAAANWLNEWVHGAPVIVEAPGSGGSSYVYEGRVSALTGLPTLLGWAGHEGQWRGSYDVQNARDPDIETLYNSLDRETALTLLDKYGISYVYVGPVERTRYDPRGLEKFAQFMDVVYEEDGVTVYRVRQ
jgi:YYY domain-containing protein